MERIGGYWIACCGYSLSSKVAVICIEFISSTFSCSFGSMNAYRLHHMRYWQIVCAPMCVMRSYFCCFASGIEQTLALSEQLRKSSVSNFDCETLLIFAWLLVQILHDFWWFNSIKFRRSREKCVFERVRTEIRLTIEIQRQHCIASACSCAYLC